LVIARIEFSWGGVFNGVVHAQALAAGILLYGMAFGVLASEARLSLLEAALMSVFVYSGSAQLAALQGWSEQSMVAAAFLMILIANSRYLLYGAALHPWLGPIPSRLVYPTLFFLGDGNWSLSMSRYAAGHRDAGSILGSGLAMYAPGLSEHWPVMSRAPL
jgi:predicted branched-subunit amino acid permease